MSAHQPKWNALHALDQGQLSAEGERRLRAHLAGCPECTRAFAAMSLYAGAKAEVQQQRVGLAPDAWERLSRAIERDAAQVPAGEPAEEEDLASAYERISTEVRLTPAPPIAANMADRVLELRAREHQDRAWSWAATLAAAACFALATQLFGAGHVGHGGSRAPEVATHHAVPP